MLMASGANTTSFARYTLWIAGSSRAGVGTGVGAAGCSPARESVGTPRCSASLRCLARDTSAEFAGRVIFSPINPPDSVPELDFGMVERLLMTRKLQR